MEIDVKKSPVARLISQELVKINPQIKIKKIPQTKNIIDNLLTIKFYVKYWLKIIVKTIFNSKKYFNQFFIDNEIWLIS